MGEAADPEGGFGLKAWMGWVGEDRCGTLGAAWLAGCLAEEDEEGHVFIFLGIVQDR